MLKRIFCFAESRIHFYFFAANFYDQQDQPIRAPSNSNNNKIVDKKIRFFKCSVLLTSVFGCFGAKIYFD